jgi:hypothetical protein
MGNQCFNSKPAETIPQNRKSSKSKGKQPITLIFLDIVSHIEEDKVQNQSHEVPNSVPLKA